MHGSRGEAADICSKRLSPGKEVCQRETSQSPTLLSNFNSFRSKELRICLIFSRTPGQTLRCSVLTGFFFWIHWAVNIVVSSAQRHSVDYLSICNFSTWRGQNIMDRARENIAIGILLFLWVPLSLLQVESLTTSTAFRTELGRRGFELLVAWRRI